MYNAAGLSGVHTCNTCSSSGNADPRPTLKMSHVVSDQKGKFDNDELFRKLSTDSAISYNGDKEKQLNERRLGFYSSCYQGKTEIGFKSNGFCLQLAFNGYAWPSQATDCDFEKEPGRAHIKSRFIMNGVCVQFRGWLDCESLDGVGCIEYVEERAFHEDFIEKNLLRQQHKQFLLDFERKRNVQFGQRQLWRAWER